MKRRFFCLTLLFSFVSLFTRAQEIGADTATVATDSVQMQADSVVSGHYYCDRYQLHLHLDTEGESLVAPGFELMGKVRGYLRGGIYGTWFVVRCERVKKGVRLRLTNDLGSYTQTLLFTPQADGSFLYVAEGGNEVRRSEGRKWVKLDDRLTFYLQKK